MKNRRLKHSRWISLANAFMGWLARQPQDVSREVTAHKRRGRVRLSFARFPTLTGRIWNHCLAVYADDKSGKYLLRIFDVDCLPIRIDTNVFVCGFCEGEQAEFGDREALWEHHLFVPFQEWITRKLKQAEGIDYRHVRGTIRPELRMPEHWDIFDDLEIDNGGVEHLRFYRSGPPTLKKDRRW